MILNGPFRGAGCVLDLLVREVWRVQNLRGGMANRILSAPTLEYQDAEVEIPAPAADLTHFCFVADD